MHAELLVTTINSIPAIELNRYLNLSLDARNIVTEYRHMARL